MTPTKEAGNIAVMIVDDHAMFREAMCFALSEYPHITVPYEAGTGEEALAMLRECEPDVILMDISLPGINGIETIRQALKIREVPIIALSMHERELYEKAAKEAGARAYALKADPMDDLVKLIEETVRDG